MRKLAERDRIAQDALSMASSIREKLPALLEQFRSKRLLVIGDLMLDEFIWGQVRRISPEAPVPVVEVTDETYYPGGAANVARNLREFCDGVDLMGVVGPCRHGAQLRELLDTEGIATGCVLEDASFQTVVKTRIIARNQQVVRVDRELREPVAHAIHEQALGHLKQLLHQVDAVVLEDYGKGFLTQPFVDGVFALAQDVGKLLTVDPNPQNPLFWRGASVVKPNRLEAFTAAGIQDTGRRVKDPAHDPVLLKVGRRLQEKWETPLLLVTLGELGMLLFDHEAEPVWIPPQAREVFDVSGAGDTVIALMTLGLCCGLSLYEAAEIANHASGVVVGKIGTATVSPEELVESFSRDD